MAQKVAERGRFSLPPHRFVTRAVTQALERAGGPRKEQIQSRQWTTKGGPRASRGEALPAPKAAKQALYRPVSGQCGAPESESRWPEAASREKRWRPSARRSFICAASTFLGRASYIVHTRIGNFVNCRSWPRVKVGESGGRCRSPATGQLKFRWMLAPADAGPASRRASN